MSIDSPTIRAWDILNTLKVRQALPYFVTFRFTNTATQKVTEETKRFATEREAVVFIAAVEGYENMEPVNYSDNIDRSKYRN
jgi:hypothetical protein